jgi:hypothetical protein
MASLKDKAITLLGSAVIDMKTAATTTIFTTPVGKTTRITHVVVRDPTASLAGGTSYSITNFRQTFSLAGMTGGASKYMVVQATDLTEYTETAEATAIQLTVTTGSSAAANATIDVFGYTT